MRPGTVFYKLTGSGNDFIALDGRHVELSAVTPEVVQALCDRRHGAGADGLMLLVPSPEPDVHFDFHFWNRDGSQGPMCGNGALCATRLASVLELAPRDAAAVCFATPSGIHRGWVREGDRSEIELPDCDLPRAAPQIAVAAPETDPMVVRPSAPHLVLEVPDVDLAEPAASGPRLRHDPALGPGGANVNWLSPRPDGTWAMRTYERGVEGETLACGTGAVACALSVALRKGAPSPVRLWTRSGLPLDVSFVVEGGRATSIRLLGEGRIVYRAILVSLPTIS